MRGSASFKICKGNYSEIMLDIGLRAIGALQRVGRLDDKNNPITILMCRPMHFKMVKISR